MLGVYALYFCVMPTIELTDIPAPVLSWLRQRAAASGREPSDEVIEILKITRFADRLAKRRVLRLKALRDLYVSGMETPIDEMVGMTREDRERQERLP